MEPQAKKRFHRLVSLSNGGPSGRRSPRERLNFDQSRAGMGHVIYTPRAQCTRPPTCALEGELTRVFDKERGALKEFNLRPHTLIEHIAMRP